MSEKIELTLVGQNEAQGCGDNCGCGSAKAEPAPVIIAVPAPAADACCSGEPGCC